MRHTKMNDRPLRMMTNRNHFQLIVNDYLRNCLHVKKKGPVRVLKADKLIFPGNAIACKEGPDFVCFS